MAGLVACSESGEPGEPGEPGASAESANHPGAGTYEMFCIACHKLGISGAPRIGSAEAWEELASTGVERLLARTIEGIPPAMPAKGGCLRCSDEQLKAAIDYMLDQSLVSRPSEE
ncbi:MAG: c-type cytochrome [Pseudomonadales bacterium]